MNTNQSFSNLYWLGGSPCGGKSSMSEFLRERFNLSVYKIDDQSDRHFTHMLDPEKHPAISEWMRSSWDQRWMQPVDDLLRFAIRAYTEHFSILINEVLQLPKDQRWLIEGCPLMPKLIQPYLADAHHAFWVLAGNDFQRSHYSKREWIPMVLSECSQPEQAFNNWMDRDAAYSEWLRNEVIQSGYAHLVNDGSRGVEENAMLIAQHFGLTGECN
ncbi:MAG: hypothetical protein JW750_03435 [Anaerolineaceae bacterium]|nr:hypothetical protein [Anaerolineaceae bacterium]